MSTSISRQRSMKQRDRNETASLISMVDLADATSSPVPTTTTTTTTSITSSSQPLRSRFECLFVASLIPAVLYIIVGTSLTFYNKWLLSSRKFHFEVTMIMAQAALNFVLSSLSLGTCFRYSLATDRAWPTNIKKGVVLYRLFPIGVLLGFDITLTSLAFRLSNVALTEIVKAGIPALVLLEGVISGRETPSKTKFFVVFQLCCGILLTTFGDLHNSSRSGLFAAVAATICGASKLILMQRVVTGTDRIHPILSLFYFMPAAVVSLLLPFMLFEANDFFASKFMSADNLWNTFALLGTGGLLAFMLNVTELVVIEVSSALSLCVAGVVKLIIVIAISTLLSSYSMSMVNMIGALLAVTGVIGYNWLRIQELRQQRQQRQYNRVQDLPDLYDKHLPDALELSSSQLSDDSELGL